MRLDWDKDSGDWRVFDERGVEIERSRRVIITAQCELVTDGQRQHGWLVTAGKCERRGDALFIK